MSILTWRPFGRPQTPAETHTAATVRREPTGQAEASFLLSVPSARPVTITDDVIARVSDAFLEYGRAVQQVTDYRLRADLDQARKAEEHGRLIHDTTIQFLKDLT